MITNVQYLPPFVRTTTQQGGVHGKPGIVDADVDSTQLARNLGEHVGDVVLFRQVALYRNHFGRLARLC